MSPGGGRALGPLVVVLALVLAPCAGRRRGKCGPAPCAAAAAVRAASRSRSREGRGGDGSGGFGVRWCPPESSGCPRGVPRVSPGWWRRAGAVLWGWGSGPAGKVPSEGLPGGAGACAPLRDPGGC